MDIKKVKKIKVNVGYLVMTGTKFTKPLLKGQVIDREKDAELFEYLTKDEDLVGEEGSGKRFIVVELEEDKKDSKPEAKEKPEEKKKETGKKTTSGRKKKKTASSK